MNDTSYYCILYTTGSDFNNLQTLIGVYNLSINKGRSFSQPFFVGGYANNFNINAPDSFEISLDKTLYTLDDGLFLTGENPITRMYIYDTSKYYEFCNLYLNYFKAQFSVGSISTISLKLSSYGECSKIIDYIPYKYNEINQSILEIPNVKNIFISGNTENVNLNRNIFSFDYELNVKREPYFSVGRSSPVSVENIPPIQISSNISSKGTNETKTFSNFENYENGKLFTNFSIIACNDSNYWKYELNCATLNARKISLSSSEIIEFEENYIGYI